VAAGPADLALEVAAYDDPDSVRFVEEVQAFYVERYGGVDRTPVEPAEFAPPRGLFLVGRLPGAGAVCCGGWRRHTPESIAAPDRHVLRPGDAEVKRMWVAPAHRRCGIAGALLAELERTAAVAGCRRTVLETGDQQPEAIAFYRDAGYTVIPRFGLYRGEAGSLCLARALTTATASGPPSPSPTRTDPLA
jgi:ribosomal protein S18 acetylase RimI-like enzyme